MKIKLFTLLFLVLNVLNISFAQFVQQGPKLVGTGHIGNSSQGISVAISSDGNTVIEGGTGDNDTGAVWVFIRNNGIWTQQGPKLIGTSGLGPGYSVAISSDGNTFVAGG